MGSMRYIQTIEHEFMTYQSPRKRHLHPISRSPRNIIKLKMESDGVDSGIPMSIFGKLLLNHEISRLEAPIFECGPGHFTQGYGFFGNVGNSALNKTEVLSITGATTSLTGI